MVSAGRDKTKSQNGERRLKFSEAFGYDHGDTSFIQ